VRAGTGAFAVKVKLIGILTRTYGPIVARKELEALLEYRDRLVAMDLAGDEANWPGDQFTSHAQRARESGLQITVHAGETAGPESVWQAVRELGAARIGHAIRAVEDPALMDHLAQQRVGVESCLTSNVQTSLVPDYASHPLRTFLDRGILATINTDDPGIGGVYLRHEYQVAAPAAGLTNAHTRQAQRNALATAFLSADERHALVAQKRAGGRQIEV
jgi:adenosine deaminase